MPQSGSPEVLEEDEAELELQKQLEKGRRLRQLQQLRDSGEKVRGLRGLGAGGRWGPRDRCVCSHLSSGARGPTPSQAVSVFWSAPSLCSTSCYWWVSRFLPCFHCGML